MRSITMNIGKLFVLAAASLPADTSLAQAVLTINGNLTTIPCTVSSEVVIFGGVPIIEFGPNGGSGANYAQNVTLTIGGCEVSTLRSASLTFSGTTVPQISNGTGLALTPVSGVAQGVAIGMTNNDAVHGTPGQAIRFDGTESYALDLASGKNTYEFRASYVRIPGQPVTPGVAGASVVVTLSYS